MKKLLVVFLAAICMVSCNSKSKTAVINGVKQATSDTAFNEKIQGVFFDTPFGARKDEVIKNFKAHNLFLNKQTSSDAVLHFFPIGSKFYTFGNMTWEMLDVYLSNGKFYAINFMNYSEDKASAIEEYDDILDAVSAKYDMMEREAEDTTIYRLSTGYTKPHPRRTVTVACYRYESISKTILQGVSLAYFDEQYNNEVSDEL